MWSCWAVLQACLLADDLPHLVLAHWGFWDPSLLVSDPVRDAMFVSPKMVRCDQSERHASTVFILICWIAESVENR